MRVSVSILIDTNTQLKSSFKISTMCFGSDEIYRYKISHMAGQIRFVGPVLTLFTKTVNVVFIPMRRNIADSALHRSIGAFDIAGLQS